eukprot:gnl/TRDRNA2_/TRDRNA2_185786_c0_seq1.p1 gnl/TRDRNA2_/TRDRNA2_185786_c0~~gnl/TRDRNA2_/TRDRNA2_185786_c0_seq1.p1  ORF type:complete len:392 (+),score=45.91 gnl/TRDRNA2_/TRDRNA2_185786_c0_seq1:98-1273(+)
MLQWRLLGLGCLRLLHAEARGELPMLRHVDLHVQKPPISQQDLPASGFPAENASRSNALWSRGVQPANLEAWPKIAGMVAPCWYTSILRDVEVGWPCQCSGLSKVPDSTEQECRLRCMQDPLCSMWQFNEHSECRLGLGQHCDDRERSLGFEVVAGQQLQHGLVTVLMQLTHVEVKHLRVVGMLDTDADAVGVDRCRTLCYSMIWCSIWQYGEDGCRVQDDGQNGGEVVQYPLTSNGGASASSKYVKSIRGGEYVQHYCPTPTDLSGEKEATVRSQDGSSAFSRFAWLLGSLLFFLGVFTVCLVFLMTPRQWKGARIEQRQASRDVPLSHRPVPMQLQMSQAVPQNEAATMPVQATPSMLPLLAATGSDEPGSWDFRVPMPINVSPQRRPA